MNVTTAEMAANSIKGISGEKVRLDVDIPMTKFNKTLPCKVFMTSQQHDGTIAFISDMVRNLIALARQEIEKNAKLKLVTIRRHPKYGWVVLPCGRCKGVDEGWVMIMQEEEL